LQETLERNGYYRNRQVKTTSPVDVPGEYPEPVELIDLIKLRCNNPECSQRYHTILPGFLAPYGHYPHSVRQTVMEAVDQGATVYSLAAQFQLFPHLIRRWKREGEKLADRVTEAILAKTRELSPNTVVAAASARTPSPWGSLRLAVYALMTVLCQDPRFRLGEERVLEFVYLFCSDRRDWRFWDREGRRKKKLSHPITVALPVSVPG
jgi:hypothetical protein